MEAAAEQKRTPGRRPVQETDKRKERLVATTREASKLAFTAEAIRRKMTESDLLVAAANVGLKEM